MGFFSCLFVFDNDVGVPEVATVFQWPLGGSAVAQEVCTIKTSRRRHSG